MMPNASAKSIVFNKIPEETDFVVRENQKYYGKYYASKYGWNWFFDLSLVNDWTVENSNTATVSSSKPRTLSGHAYWKSITVKSGGTITFEPGEFYIESLILETGSKIKFNQPGKPTILHLKNMAVWRATLTGVTSEDDKKKVAKGLKIIQHTKNNSFFETAVYGTVYNPLGVITIAGTNDTNYGRFVGYDVRVQPNVKIESVKFQPGASAAKKMTNNGDIEVVDNGAENLRPDLQKSVLKSVNRNEITFSTAKAGNAEICLMNVNGAVVYSRNIELDVPGTHQIEWNTQGIPQGRYVVTIKNGREISGGPVYLK